MSKKKTTQFQMGFFEHSMDKETVIEDESGKKICTIGDLRVFIRTGEIKPSDLFALDKLHDDPQVKKYIKEQADLELEYRDNEAHARLNKDKLKEIEAKEDQVAHIPGD